jgi:riboflavin synthase
MFTGIIETLARVENLEYEGTNVHFTFSSSISGELKVDQSVSHNGVCLTVTEVSGSNYKVTAINETLRRTSLGALQKGDEVNLERCMPATGRFDGHIVQGHVDCTGICESVRDLNGSWEFIFSHTRDRQYVTVEKGSITVNGVSLTVVLSEPGRFSVHIIPYTFEHTSFKSLQAGSKVNLEFDIVGKYVARLLQQRD